MQRQLAIMVPLVDIKLKSKHDFDCLVSISLTTLHMVLCELVAQRVPFVIGSLHVNNQGR